MDIPAHYNGAPTFSYSVGQYYVSKEGIITGEWNLRLMVALENKGFEYEPSKTFHLITPRGTLLIQEQFLTAEDAQAEGYEIYFSHGGRDIYIKPSSTSEHGKYFAVVGEPFEQKEEPNSGIDTITIEYPLEGFTPETLDNLLKMVEIKEVLIKQVLNTDTLPIQVLEDRIAFPWFKYTDNAYMNAYMQFITVLCQTAQEKKRVIAKAQETFENPRFAMRVWLIGLEWSVFDQITALRKLPGCPNMFDVKAVFELAIKHNFTSWQIWFSATQGRIRPSY